jgi:hypothetical protein
VRVLSADFLRSATDPHAGAGWPEEGPPEVAFIGRSNVGKSTLLSALVEAIQHEGRSVVVYRLHEGARHLPTTPRNVRSLAARELVVVDGYEQLPRWRQWMLRAHCRRRGLGLLVTTHAATGLPLLWATSADLTTAQRVVAHLLTPKIDGDALISKDDVAAALAANPTNVREALFALYDVYERRRKAVS